MLPLSGLSSLLGGALGGGVNSSASQSTPFYNDSGIYFRSAGAGGIDAGDVGSTASSGAPKSAGGIQAFPDSSLGATFSSPTDNSIIYYVIGGIILLVVGGYLAFKK